MNPIEQIQTFLKATNSTASLLTFNTNRVTMSELVDRASQWLTKTTGQDFSELDYAIEHALREA